MNSIEQSKKIDLLLFFSNNPLLLANYRVSSGSYNIYMFKCFVEFKESVMAFIKMSFKNSFLDGYR